MIGTRDFALDYKLAIDTLPVQGSLEIMFISRGDGGVPSVISDGKNSFQHHVLGEFHHQVLGRDCIRKFLVLLECDAQKRTINSLSCEEDVAQKGIRIRSSW